MNSIRNRVFRKRENAGARVPSAQLLAQTSNFRCGWKGVDCLVNDLQNKNLRKEDQYLQVSSSPIHRRGHLWQRPTMSPLTRLGCFKGGLGSRSHLGFDPVVSVPRVDRFPNSPRSEGPLDRGRPASLRPHLCEVPWVWFKLEWRCCGCSECWTRWSEVNSIIWVPGSALLVAWLLPRATPFLLRGFYNPQAVTLQLCSYNPQAVIF